MVFNKFGSGFIRKDIFDKKYHFANLIKIPNNKNVLNFIENKYNLL